MAPPAGDQVSAPEISVPEISVVVPTIDRVALLERCLRGLSTQQDVTFEVIVVGGDDPGIAALVESWKGRLPLRFLASRVPGASVKRNVGWSVARAPIVAFTDDDCEPAPGWLTSILGGFTDPAIDLVQGTVAAHPDDRAVAGIFARTIEVREATPTYPNANLAYRHAALERAGGYDSRLRSGEDTDLAWRVLEPGGQARFVREALVWHAIRPVGFRAHLRSLPRWSSLPAVVRRHPQLRDHAYRRWFWKNTHPVAWLALFGLAASLRHPAALALILPHVLRRRHPGLIVSDWAECLVLGAGSLRHRSVLL
jgi:glycosyltransferase involved in cell wall biosynthesis